MGKNRIVLGFFDSRSSTMFETPNVIQACSQPCASKKTVACLIFDNLKKLETVHNFWHTESLYLLLKPKFETLV